MEPNDSNMKPQPTGGLKLMTVFIAVLALHVVVIGGFTVWHLLYPSSVENDLAADKAHKNAKSVADSSITEMNTGNDTAVADKTPGTAAAAATEAETPATTEPAAPATASVTPAVPATTVAAQPPVIVPAQPEDSPSMAANPPASGPVRHGPVVTPPSNLAPPAEPSAASVIADTPSSPPAVPSDAAAYTVKKGDSLARIAHRHHVSVANLRAANGLAGDGLHIGQKLTIPAKAARSTAVATTESPAPAPASIAPVAQPVQDADMASATGMSLPEPLSKHSSHKLASAPSHHSYTVVKGDTLTKIAKRYHTTTTAIMAANNLSNAGRLSIGQRLHIPAHESRAASTAEGTMPQEPEAHSTAKGQLANYTP